MVRTPKNLKNPELRQMCRFFIRLQRDHQKFLADNFELMMNALLEELRFINGEHPTIEAIGRNKSKTSGKVN